MRQRYVSIAAASLTALVVGVGPALAQNTTISPNVNPNIGVNPSVGVDVNGNSNASGQSTTPQTQSPSASPGGSVSGSDSATGSGTVSGSGGSVSRSGGVNTNDKGSVNTDTQSPSASPRGDDDRAKPDNNDRQKMKDQEQIDKKTGLDRADEAAGSHGQQGRDNARTRGNRQ